MSELTYEEASLVKLKENQAQLKALDTAYAAGMKLYEDKFDKMLLAKMDYGRKSESDDLGSYWMGYADACGELLEGLKDD